MSVDLCGVWFRGGGADSVRASLARMWARGGGQSVTMYGRIWGVVHYVYICGGGWGDKMERKAFHALLLSGIVAAGAMTITDVYAQTNTDRLIAVADERTDGLPGMLDSIMSAVSDGVAEHTGGYCRTADARGRRADGD